MKDLPHIALRSPRVWTAPGVVGKTGALAVTWFALIRQGFVQLDPEEVAMRAGLAAEYVASAQLPDGTFAYEYDFLQGCFVDKNNIVRQAGAGFVLAEYLHRSCKMEFRSNVERAVAAFATKSISHEDGLVVADGYEPAEAPTGATALALLAELHYFAATGDSRFAETRRGWLRALTALQRATGGFAASPGSETESPYFNGESWLALAEFARLFPVDEPARSVLAKADDYLTRRYAETPDVSFFHWGLMAAAVRYETSAEARFLEFIRGQAEVYLSKLRPKARRHTNSGSAVEGLAAAAAALSRGGRGSGRLYRRIMRRVIRELEKAFEMQIMRGQDQIMISDRQIPLPAEIRFAGAFLNGRRRPQTRIDFTQHCLSAMLKYSALKEVRMPSSDGAAFPPRNPGF